MILTDNGPVADDGEEAGGSAGAPPPSRNLEFAWIGSDGAEWDLVRGSVGLLTGARGFGLPTPQHWLRQGVNDGAWWEGLRFPPRDVYMPVEVRDRDIPSTERAFFAGMDPRTEGLLRVTTPDAQSRELPCRYIEGAEGEYEIDPLQADYVSHGIHMTAADPFWRGLPISIRFAYPDATPAFFTGPPFRLAPSDVLGASTLDNPGDVDAYAVWRLDGPFSAFTVGVGDSPLFVASSLPKAAGEWIEIDTNPRRLTILDDEGTDLQDEGLIDEAIFGSIPPGEVTVTSTLNGASRGSAVTVSFTPRYYRAW